MKEWLNEVVAFSRQSRDDGNRYWGRISGTQYELMTADWTDEKFRSLGLENIHRQEFELGPQWTPIDWSLVTAQQLPRFGPWQAHAELGRLAEARGQGPGSPSSAA